MSHRISVDWVKFEFSQIEPYVVEFWGWTSLNQWLICDDLSFLPCSSCDPVTRTCRVWPVWWAWSRRTSATWTTSRRRTKTTRKTGWTRRRRLPRSQVGSRADGFSSAFIVVHLSDMFETYVVGEAEYSRFCFGLIPAIMLLLLTTIYMYINIVSNSWLLGLVWSMNRLLLACE